MDKIRIYDEIISVSISNAGAERQRNGICLIREFDPKNPRHMLYYEASLIYCSIIGEPLYLYMPFFKYIGFILKHWKSRKQLKFLSYDNLMDYELQKSHSLEFVISSATTIMNHVAGWANEMYELSAEEFDKIYEEVYGDSSSGN